jgi:hypothetical protein
MQSILKRSTFEEKKETDATMSVTIPIKAVSLKTSDGGGDSDNEEDNRMTSVEEILRHARISMNTSLPNLEMEDIPGSPDGRKNAVSFRDVPDSPAASDDREKTFDQLLLKTQILDDKLRKAELDVSAEKIQKKKKDKNIMKLAKQLKRRNELMEEDTERLEKVRTNKRERAKYVSETKICTYPLDS